MPIITSGVELILKGGLVMYPLLISVFIALTIIIERLYLFHRVYRTPPQIISSIFNYLKAKDFDKALDLCRKNPSPVSSVLQAGIEHFENPIEEMELSMKNRAESWVPLLEKRIEVIDTVITAAPLLGLLGTITGMMASSEVLSEKGVNEPNAITGGVAEALIATATGLLIALLCLVFYNYLTTRVKLFIYDVESAASQLVEARLSIQRLSAKKSESHT